MTSPLGETVLVKYTGHPDFVTALVFAIESEGGAVTIAPMAEPVHLRSDVEAFLIVAASGTDGGVCPRGVAEAGLAKFADRFGDNGSALIKPDAAADDQTSQ